MSVLAFKSALTQEERLQKRQLIIRDTLALLSLLAITVALFVATWALFRSFSNHRASLGTRWRMRGEAALHAGRAADAVDALRSALQYSPGDRDIEIELATALAAAGRLQEATAYFNTLWEAEPGNGHINLALARLAVREGNQPSAMRYYQASIDGTWQGDGSIRRREVRLELVKYLLDRQQLDQARSELLIAAGNAPDDPLVRMHIASLLETAQDPSDALEIYRSVLRQRPLRIAALQGAGRSAFAMGRFLQAKQYMERALGHPESQKENKADRDQDRNLLDQSNRILLLYPSQQLAPRGRAERILHDRSLAESRFTACSSSAAANPQKRNPQPLLDLSTRWDHEAHRPTTAELERDPALQQAEIDLIYDTEKVTADQCGAPAGDDALLLKIAQNPDAVEEQ